MLPGGDQGHPCEPTDRHAWKDFIIQSELASSFRLLLALSSKPPAIEVRRCVKHLQKSCALSLSDRHELQSSNTKA